MSKRKRRVFSREFKLSAVQRVIAGEHTAEVSCELGVPSGHLYQWYGHFAAAEAAEAEWPATSVLARTNSNSPMETRGAPRCSNPFSWPGAWCGRWDLNPHGIAPKGF
jgi:transposase-like protein